MGTLEYIFLLLPYWFIVAGIFAYYLFMRKTQKRFKGLYRAIYLIFFAPAVLAALVAIFVLNPAVDSEYFALITTLKIFNVFIPFIPYCVMQLIFN